MVYYKPTSPRFPETRNIYTSESDYTNGRAWYQRSVAKVAKPMEYVTVEEALKNAGLK